MNDCPHCGRKFLSKASARCNWCGKEIEDPTYQAEAQTAREAFFAHQAAHDAQSLANMRAVSANAADPFGQNIPLIDSPLLGFDPRPLPARQRARQASDDRATQRAVAQALAEQRAEAARRAAPVPRSASGFPQRPGAAPPEPPAVPEPPEKAPETTGDRFRHLEL